MKHINFHCHCSNCPPTGVNVISYNVDEFIQAQQRQYVTLGVHPWLTAHSDVYNWISRLRELCGSDNVIGVGEIGLDRFKGIPLQVQEIMLRQQLDIALEMDKPVVIHCVRAWSELVKILSESRYVAMKVAIHGFRQHAGLVQQLVDKGYYISFGSLVVDPTPELAETLTAVPLDRIFFETDTSNMPIDEIYHAASDILNIPVERIEDQIINNFGAFFGINTCSLF